MDSFEKIYIEHRDRIHRLVRAYLPDAEARKDLFQNIVFNLWRSLKSFRGECGTGTWVYRIAFNTALMFLRSQYKWNKIPDNMRDWSEKDIPDSPETSLENKQETDRLYRAIHHLDKTDRLIITLFLEDLSYREIAEIAGIGTNHVGVKLNRIKTKLSRILKEVSHGT